jgi:hypothetical protein
MRRWLRKLSSNKRTAPLFVTCVQLPDGRQIPEEFREKDVTGLEHLLLLKKLDNEVWMAAFWSCRESFFIARDSLESRFGSFRNVEEFYVTDQRGAKPTHFWGKILTTTAGLAALAAICLNIRDIEAVIQTEWAALKDTISPRGTELSLIDAELDSNGLPMLKAVDGDRTLMNLECVNLGRAPCSLTLSPVKVVGLSDKTNLGFNVMRPFPILAGGSTQAIQIRCAPRGLGMHKLAVTVNSVPGHWFWGNQTREIVIPIDVWPELDAKPKCTLRSTTKRYAVVDVVAKHGRAQNGGVKYQATLDSSADADIRFAYVDDLAITEVYTKGHPWGFSANGVATVQWSSSANLKAFSEDRHELLLEGSKKQRSDVEWKQIESEIKTDAEKDNDSALH